MSKLQTDRYLLCPDYALRGWKRLPFAIQNLRTGNTEFLRKPQFLLFLDCDGQTEINLSSLSPEDRDFYQRMLKYHYIRKCEPGEKLSPEQEYLFYPARYKSYVQWSITGKCNYRCKHCFMSAPHAAMGEPSFDECMQILDAFARCGVKSVDLTGGEPLIRSDFWKIVDAILERKMLIHTVYSNGKLVTDEFLDEMQKRNLHFNIQMSFDGIGWHDWLRGVKGAEKLVIDAFQRCRERNIRTGASMVLFRENLGTIRETVKLLGELGCKGLKLCGTTPQGEWINQKEHFLTQDEIYQAFMDYIPQYFEDGTPVPIIMEGFFSYNPKDHCATAINEKNCPEEFFSKRTMCSNIRNDMYVSPQGLVLPCMTMAGTAIEEQFPNMLETPLEEILDESFYMRICDARVSDYMEHNPECAVCEYRSQCCGGCRAYAVGTNGLDYLAKDERACHYFKSGWMERKEQLLAELGIKSH
ncbi:MAG: radical SAM protein [Oliverpabstia sp.]